MSTDRGDCDYETLQRFDRLPCPYKELFQDCVAWT